MRVSVQIGALRLARLSLAVAIGAFGSRISAQAYIDPPPNVLTDENGVNLAEGSITYQLAHTLPAVDPALQPYVRYWMGTGWRDTMTMTLTVN